MRVYRENTLGELMLYFRVTQEEFAEFWASLTFDERLYYRRVPLV